MTAKYHSRFERLNFSQIYQGLYVYIIPGFPLRLRNAEQCIGRKGKEFGGRRGRKEETQGRKRGRGMKGNVVSTIPPIPDLRPSQATSQA